MVNRLKIDARGFTLEKDDNGYLVRFDDYKELEQRLKGVSSLCEKAMSNEVEWEKEMANATGKYSPASVAKEIEDLKMAHYALQQKLDAMAAENVALKIIVECINSELYGKGFAVAGWHLNGALEPLDNWFTDNAWGLPETPTTDAYLNSVRAEGVEMYASHFNVNHSIVSAMVKSTATEFAEQLRSGTHDAAGTGADLEYYEKDEGPLTDEQVTAFRMCSSASGKPTGRFNKNLL